MALQINLLEQEIERLHIRLRRNLRALYVLHSNGNDQAALIALDRVTQLNAKIAELHALIDSWHEVEQDRDMTVVVPALPQQPEEVVLPQPQPEKEEVVLDDPDQDDVHVEYNGTVFVTIFVIIIAALMTLFIGSVPDVTAGGAKKPMPPTNVTVTVNTPEPAEVAPQPLTEVTVAAVESVTYTVQQGDTLWSIAKQQLGDGSAWANVYGQNASVLGDDPNLIFPGQVLTISKVSVSSESIG